MIFSITTSHDGEIIGMTAMEQVTTSPTVIVENTPGVPPVGDLVPVVSRGPRHSRRVFDALRDSGQQIDSGDDFHA